MRLDIEIPGNKLRHPCLPLNIWSPRTRMTDSKARTTHIPGPIPRRPRTFGRVLGDPTRRLLCKH